MSKESRLTLLVYYVTSERTEGNSTVILTEECPAEEIASRSVEYIKSLFDSDVQVIIKNIINLTELHDSAWA